jgi:hypothetical protein
MTVGDYTLHAPMHVVCRLPCVCSFPYGGQDEYPYRIRTPPLALDQIFSSSQSPALLADQLEDRHFQIVEICHDPNSAVLNSIRSISSLRCGSRRGIMDYDSVAILTPSANPVAEGK